MEILARQALYDTSKPHLQWCGPSYKRWCCFGYGTAAYGKTEVEAYNNWLEERNSVIHYWN